MFQLPAFEHLQASRHVLLLGAGGGYDILGAVPLFMEKRRAGKQVHLGGVSFTTLSALPGAEVDPRHSCLFAVSEASATPDCYCPEAWLARWLSIRHGHAEPLWALAKVGVQPLRAALRDLTERLGVDTIVLVDGGIDLTLRGDETSIGTPAEDLASLCAVAGLPGLRAFAMCVGFGTELREGIPHAQVLERFAELQRTGAYLGAVSLHPGTEAGAAYAEAVSYVLEGQKEQRATHVHRIVLAAMEGQFGSPAPDIWISPLASLCWFFSVPELARSHLFLPQLEQTETIFDVTSVVRGSRKGLAVRPRSDIPI